MAAGAQAGKDQAVVDILVKFLLSENDGKTCNNIADVLGYIKDTRAIEPMIISLERVEDTGECYSQERRGALKKLTGVEFRDVKEWRQWWENNKGKFKKD